MTDGDASASPPVEAALLVDDAGMHFRCDRDCALDVLFDGRRVWSIASGEQKKERRGYRFAPWPDPIRTRLDGLVLVELREHVTGEIIASAEGTFGSGTGRVAIVDKEGRPVAVTKYGRLNHPFESTDRAALEGYLDQVEEVLHVLREECNLPAFISFGTLLGAVRTGKFIGHDVDVDLGYLSDFENPVDIIRESLRVERVFQDKGWQVVRQNGGFLALFLPQADGTSRNMDVFSCFVVDDMLYEVHDVRAKAGRSAVVPLSSIDFEGRRLPVPAEPEVFLESAYGPGWRVPDPSFEYHTPIELKRRIQGWLGGLRARRDYWVKFYAANEQEIPTEPTDLARWLVTREPAGQLVDVGCGNGRDTLFFAGSGYDVIGVDFAPGVVDRARRRAEAQGLSVDFHTWNLYSLRTALVAGGALAHTPGPRVVYARFLLHTLTDPGRELFWRFTAMALSGGGRCYLEFRTPRDAGRTKVFGRSFRRFLDPDAVAAEAAAHGASVVHRESGTGLAKLKHEDPYVCRMILEW